MVRGVCVYLDRVVHRRLSVFKSERGFRSLSEAVAVLMDENEDLHDNLRVEDERRQLAEDESKEGSE